MSQYPYTPPEFLQNQRADDIHGRMMAALPDDIDKSENQIPWDFTRPAAIEKAEFVEFELNETIKLIFPQWAYNEWLDLHAQMEGITRRPSNKASAILIVTGKPGTNVAQGFQFATAANLTASVIFEVTEDTTLDGEADSRGQVTVNIPVQATEGGKDGNVPPDTIMLMVKPESGIAYVTNPKAATGGTPEETDDDLRERVLDMIRLGMSYTGCDSDYIRWAREVPGVGSAIINAEWAGPGTVRLFIIDANGLPANPQILEAVYSHIIRPDDRIERLAPIGATLTVDAPAPLYIDITAGVKLKDGETLTTVTDRFKENLDRYWLEATSESSTYDVEAGTSSNYVKYVYVGATLANTAGIANYSDLTVNEGAADVLIPLGMYPVTRGVTLLE